METKAMFINTQLLLKDHKETINHFQLIVTGVFYSMMNRKHLPSTNHLFQDSYLIRIKQKLPCKLFNFFGPRGTPVQSLTIWTNLQKVIQSQNNK